MKMKYIAMALAVMSLTTIVQVKGVSASDLNSNGANSIIPYIQDNGEQAINIVDLAKAMHTEVKKVDGGVEMFLNNKRVVIYDNDVTIYINGTAVPYKTTKMKDFTTGETYEIPMSQKPTKSGDGYLIPKNIVQDKIGIECSSDGIHVADVKVQSASSVDTSSSYDRSSSSTVNDGWKSEGGVWHYYKNGTKATGWVQDNSKWYFLGTDGSMRVGWIQDGGNWYYLNGDGSMAHDTTISGYYLGSNGAWTTAPAYASSGSATGISYSDLLNRVEGLGFDRKTRFSAEQMYGDYGPAWGFYWKDNTYGSIGIYDKGMLNVTLNANNSEFNRAVKQIFNWMLPTQGNELIRILTTNPSNQTLTMDGRTVKIFLTNSSISVTVSG